MGSDELTHMLLMTRVWHHFGGVILPIFITMCLVIYFTQTFLVQEAATLETGTVSNYAQYIQAPASLFSANSLIIVGGGLLVFMGLLLVLASRFRTQLIACFQLFLVYNSPNGPRPNRL